LDKQGLLNNFIFISNKHTILQRKHINLVFVIILIYYTLFCDLK
jgi:hypothetical protein